jgi:flagellar biosynthesis protein FlhA
MNENSFLNKLKVLTTNSDMAIAVCLVLIMGVMIVPVSPFIMDVLIAISIASSMMILLMSIYAKRPLDFSTFPSLLLVTTFFRLALNVASTRNILIHGGTDGVSAAGEIIRSFGDYVVGGNFAVGIILFIILVIINFIVITKGAGRVAEVAARFTLDAMPGKQMAIDADLNAGLIDEATAKKRRAEVAAEADFYGSMDGASKFVRGDAIAGIMITFINIIGGIIVGMAQNDMNFSDATEIFTLLTVGDGLIAQIPAIVISIAAGIIATRNSEEDTLGNQIGIQLIAHPRALYISAGVLMLFGLIPNFPFMPFAIIAAGLIYAAKQIDKNNAEKAQKAKLATLETKTTNAENLEELLNLEMVELEVGYGLVNVVDSEQSGELLERISQIRKQFALDWGIIVPSVRIKDNLELKPGGYNIKIKGVVVAKGDLKPDHFMAMDPGTVIEKIEGIETVEPVFGLNAVWITDDQRDDAQFNGYTVVDLATVMATHLTEILKSNLHELFGRQELVRIIDNFKQTFPKVVSDLIPDILPLGSVLKVMQNLLRESVSVRDLRTILETLAEYGPQMKDNDQLTEMVRQSLYRSITETIKSANGDIPLFTLDRTIEESIAKSIIQTEQGQQLSLDPRTTQNILAGLNDKIEEATSMGEKMVVLCSPVIRRHFKKLTEKFIPQLVVVSHGELSPDINVRSLGTVRL